jgi:2-polyprenyl-3-methyl-5-hydroxy-6-metoxy-1,4-benzoquinol methylase
MVQPELFLKDCPLCGSHDFSGFYRRHHIIHIFYSYCNSCGLVFQNPTYSKEEWDRFYKYDYRKIYDNNVDPTESSLLLQRNRAEFYLQVIRNEKIKFNSHLDIGSSTGELLVKIKEDCKIKVQAGIELDAQYRKFSLSRGVKVFESLAEAIEEGTRYELVTMNHVLEHIPQPASFLRSLSKLIDPNGYLFIEVPNIEGGMGAMELAHPLAFSPETITKILNNAGFKITFMKMHGEPKHYSPRCKKYILVIAKFSNVELNIRKMKKNALHKTKSLMQRRFNWKEPSVVYWLKFPYRMLKHGYKF